MKILRSHGTPLGNFGLIYTPTMVGVMAFNVVLDAKAPQWRPRLYRFKKEET